MTSARRVVMFGLLSCCVAAASVAPAAATGTDPFAMFASMPTIGNAQLSVMRGRFIVPHAGAPSAAAASAVRSGPGITGATDGVFTSSTERSAQSVGPSISGLGTNVVYFGVQMSSQWQAPSGNSTQGVAVGLNLGINVQTQTLTISTWSSSKNGGLPTGPTTGNSIDGTPPVTNISDGVGQSIQVVGDGNTVVNNAGLVVSADTPNSIITATTTACGSTCTTTVGPNSVGIAIATAEGTVSQSIGSTGVLQTVQLNGDANQVANQLTMQAQVGPPASSGVGNIFPILQTLVGLP